MSKRIAVSGVAGSHPAEVAEVLPPINPTGWRLLVDPIDVKDTTDGGIALAEETIRAKRTQRWAAKVIAMGPLAYKDVDKFGINGVPVPWCKVGDIVGIPQYAGQPVIVKINGEPYEFRLMNDDEVLAVITDPDAVDFNF